VSWAREARLTLAALGDVDRVVAHWAIPSGFPVATARSRGVPLEIVSHGADVRTLTRLPRLVRERIVRRLVAETQTWRFVSRSLQEELARALPSRDAAALDAVSDVVPAAIELPDVRARSAALRVESGGLPFFALVGRLVPSKRFDAALEWVATRHGRPTPRVVVVGDGPDRASLAARARSLGVEAHFVGLTSREEALAWIGAADALVHASRAEGLSTVVREATALGVRVETVP
jgi:glycosyltransferase involved in cell wall biosynthesis